MAPGEENERWEAKGGQIVRLGGEGMDVCLSTHLPQHLGRLEAGL